MADTILVRGTYGLLEMPTAREHSGCCKAPAFFSAEHDNFYCSACRKGQGNEFFVRNRSIEDTSDD